MRVMCDVGDVCYSVCDVWCVVCGVWYVVCGMWCVVCDVCMASVKIIRCLCGVTDMSRMDAHEYGVEDVV